MPEQKPKLSEIEGRAEGATEGPWRFWNDGVVGFPGLGMGVLPAAGSEALPGNGGQMRTDAAFIAAARTDVPAMAAAIRAVLDVHRIRDEISDRCCEGCETANGWEACVAWPCSTYRALAAHLDLDA